jgi:predicted AAA+ superfamily ATPase
MYVNRIAENNIKTMLASGKVGIVLGARQVGKTTLVEHVLAGSKAVFLNFDIEIDKQRFLASASLPPGDAMKSLGSPEVLVVDEAQRLPETGRIVKGWHDTRVPVRILLLGSSSLDILNQSAESLTGRNEKLLLPPLLFEEALKAQSWYADEYTPEIITKNFSQPLRVFLLQAMAFGLYPEVVTAENKPPLLRNLSSDYLWKDILHSALVKTPDMIRKLLTLLAHQAGSEVSVNELAVQLHISRPTVERYLELLEQTFVIFRLPSFSTNARKEIAKSKKIYFWDTGIRNALLNAFSTDALRPDIGSLWENWVIAEAAKHNLLHGAESELFFWRSRAQSEVDLVIKTGEQLQAFEIKWSGGHTAARAFRDKYGVDVQLIDADNPFIGTATGIGT